MTDYKRAFKVACELLNGAFLYGVDSEKIFEVMLNKDGVVDNESYENYILSHIDELDHGQYKSTSSNTVRNAGGMFVTKLKGRMRHEIHYHVRRFLSVLGKAETII